MNTQRLDFQKAIQEAIDMMPDGAVVHETPGQAAARQLLEAIQKEREAKAHDGLICGDCGGVRELAEMSQCWSCWMMYEEGKNI